MRLLSCLASLLLAAPCGYVFADSPPLHAFTTSVWGPGDLHSWDDAISTPFYGLDAADRICSARAEAAGLPDPKRYTAWLSDRNNDAYCRIFGLRGKKSDSCGQAELPIGAGPWLRNDETPFASTIEDALDNRHVYAPLDIDEFGNTFLVHTEAFTATYFDGRFDTTTEEDADCEEWTSAVLDIGGPFPTLGSSLATSDGWTSSLGGVSCDGTRRLMCLQRNAGADLSGHSSFGHREAFVSSAEVSGNIGGMEGADALCRNLARNAGLYRPDSFTALLASSTSGISLVDRLTIDGPWYRRDGLLFANDKAELASGSVTRPLNVTESRAYVGYSVALTASNNDGSPFEYGDCDEWTSTTGVTSGSMVNEVAFSYTGQDWASVAQVPCAAPAPQDWPNRVYCLSDADVLFHDEFDRTLPDL